MENRDVNLIIEDVKMNIVNELNNSNLPISVAYYILKDVMNELSNNYDNYIKQARRQEQVAMTKEPPAPEENIPSENEDN